MKNYIFVLIIMTSSVMSMSQTINQYSFEKIDKLNYQQCKDTRSEFIKPRFLDEREIIFEGDSMIVILIGRPSLILENDTLNGRCIRYEYIGQYSLATLGAIEISLIKKNECNREEYYIINHIQARVDTLIGPPVISKNRIDFFCLGKSNKEQIVQLCEFRENHVVNTRGYIHLKNNILLEEIKCIERNKFFGKDNLGTYWQINIK